MLRRWARAALFGLYVGSILAGLLWTLLLWPEPAGRYARTDFATFMATGRAVANGSDPYRLPPDLYLVEPGDVPIGFPNLNPPLSLLLFEPLAALPPEPAFLAWYALSLLLYGLLLLIGRRLPGARLGPLDLLWAFSLAGLWRTLSVGQIYVPLALLATVALWLGGRGATSSIAARVPTVAADWLLAGLAMGAVVAFKPNFLVWPALLLLAGHRRVALAGLATAAGLSLLPLLRYGPSLYADWLLVAAEAARLASPGSGSLPGLAARLGLPALGLYLAGGLLLGLAVWARWQRPDWATIGGVALVASLLAAPLAWIDYSVFLPPPLLARRWSWPLSVGAVGLTFPFLMLLPLTELSWLAQVLAGSLYTWVYLLLLIGLLRPDAPPVTEPRRAAGGYTGPVEQ